MPHVIIKMYPGAAEEQKKELTKQVTDSIMRVFNKESGSISVAIEEVSENEWMDKVYETEIRPNLDKIYKKPEY